MAVLISDSCSPQLDTSQSHKTTDTATSTYRGMPVYSSAFAGNHQLTPEGNGKLHDHIKMSESAIRLYWHQN